MNFRLTLVLLAVLVLLGGGVWYSEFRSPVTPTPPAGQATVFDLNSQDVTRIEVQNKGARAVVERGTDNVWRLVEPQPGEADNTTVDTSASRLAKLNSSRKLDSPGNPADYGLATADTVLRLVTRDGTVNELQLGLETPDKSSYYAKRPNADTVYVISAFVIGDVLTWPATPPKVRPTPTALPPLPVPAGSPVGGG